MSKDIICCTQNAVSKHMVRATKLSYQKSGNARIKLAYLIPFIPLKKKRKTVLHRIVFLTSMSVLFFNSLCSFLSSVIDWCLICCTLLKLFSTLIYWLSHRVFYGTCRYNIWTHYSSPQRILVETNFCE